MITGRPRIWYLILPNFFSKVVPGTKYSSKIFQKFFGSKNKVFGTGTNTLKKTSFEFFSSISWGLCTGSKGEKVVIFGFSTRTKGEFRILRNKNLIFHI
jgi:hypothetical protein